MFPLISFLRFPALTARIIRNYADDAVDAARRKAGDGASLVEMNALSYPPLGMQ
jgi:hypothetical protein